MPTEAAPRVLLHQTLHTGVVMKLHQRGHTYHLRVRVPSDLIDIIGRREIHQSLRTTDGRKARSSAAILKASITSGFDRLRMARISNQQEDQLSELANGFLGNLGSTRRIVGGSIKIRRPVRLKELMDMYLAEKMLSIDPRSYGKMEFSFRMAIHLMGNVPLKDLNRSLCRSYRESLRKTPKFLLRPDVPSENEETFISDKTVNHHLQYLSALLRWGTLEELVAGNPAEGLCIRKWKRDWEERYAYSGDQLQHLLGDLWSCSDRIERRWVPLIALWSGMRQEEICQLRHCDIVEKGGAYFFNVTGDAGSLKSAAAERMVPVHPWLISHGLLTEAWRPDLDQQRIWSALKKTALRRYSNSLCKWFSGYKRRKGFVDRRYCFHSLRHTFINEMKQREVPEPIIRQLVGHQETSMTMGRYGKSYDLEKLDHYMKVVSFDLKLTN
jgi:integrase